MAVGTTIAIDFETKRLLDTLKKVLGLKSYDETIRELAQSKNALLLGEIAGILPKNAPPFTRDKKDFDRNIGH